MFQRTRIQGKSEAVNRENSFNDSNDQQDQNTKDEIQKIIAASVGSIGEKDKEFARQALQGYIMSDAKSTMCLETEVMKKLQVIFLVNLTVQTSTMTKIHEDKTNWELVQTKNGISLYRKNQKA